MKSIRPLLFLLSIICHMTVYAAEDELVFSFDSGNASRTYWGTEKREKYDVAVALVQNEFDGALIKGIEIPVDGADKMTDVKVWISSELKDNGKSDDLYSYAIDMEKDFDAASGTIRHTLYQPLQINESQKIYVGFSFSLSSLSAGARKPLATVPGEKGETYIKTASLSNIGKWKDLCIVSGMSSCIRVLMGNTKKNAACFAPLKTLNLKTDCENTIPVSVRNHGSKGISDLRYEGKMANHTFSGTISLESPVTNIYGASRDVQITLPALDKTGTYTLELTVSQINGSSNEDNTSVSTEVNAFTVLPVKRPLMEEYTSASCGYCPKGMAGMDIMKKRKGEDFIAVSFHTWGDPLDFFTEMPAGSGASLSLPIAQIDRNATIDPYLGNNKDSFGLDKCWEEAAERFSTAAIALEGSFDGTDAVLDSDVIFVHSVEADAYRVEFFVVADGLVVPGANQKNYYSKNETCRGMEGLDKFVDSPNVIKDYAYDDAVVAWSGKNGGVNLPSAREYEILRASETLTVPTVARSSMLRGVAAVVDNATGEVINAIQLPLNSSGIISTTEERMPVETSYWTLQGIPVANPDGICIRRVIYSDGYCETSKTVVVKN